MTTGPHLRSPTRNPGIPGRPVVSWSVSAAAGRPLPALSRPGAAPPGRAAFARGGIAVEATRSLLSAMLAQSTTVASGILNESLLYAGIAQDVTVQSPTSATTWAEVAPCTGSLSLGVSVGPWLGPYPLNDGSEVLEGEIIRFTPATSVDNQSAAYWWLGNSPQGGTLLGFEQLPQIFNLVAGGDPLSIVPRLSVTPQALGSVSQAFDG